MSNPIEMKSIIRDVEENYFPELEIEKKKHKKHKKEKKEKKSKKSKHKSRDRDDSEERSRSRNKKKRSRSSSRSSSRSPSSEHDKSTNRSSNQSKVYQEYLKDKFGGVLKEDEDGNLKPDYNRFKNKYKTQVQMDE